MIVYEIIPSPIACPIDDETGIARSIRMTGTATEISSKLIDLSALTISTPTYTSADDVAAAGIIAATGARNIHATNKTPVVSAVSPVLPPASTPDADSINVVIVEVPVSEPVTVPIASDRRASFILGMLPSLSSIPAREAVPTSVPIVSNISIRQNVITSVITVNTPRLASPAKLSLNSVVAAMSENAGTNVALSSAAKGFVPSAKYCPIQ